MLAWLPPLFFFAVLMGSPVPGFLVLMLIGTVHAWQSWRQPHSAHAFQWTRQDTWLALSLASIPLFKALTALWAFDPHLALLNAGAHSYFLFWPLVLIGLARSKTTQDHIDRALALGLIAATVWRLSFQLTQWSWLFPGTANVGILAQLTMVAGIWNLLALTRPAAPPRLWRLTYGLAFMCTFILLILTTRRLELLGFVALTFTTLAYRYQKRLTFPRIALGCLSAIAVLSVLLYVRWDRFSVGFQEMLDYFGARSNDPQLVLGSWSIRAEFWKVGLMAFAEHPVLGMGASARPDTLTELSQWPAQLSGHKHFHSHVIEVLAQGGLLGLVIFVISLQHGVWQLIIKPFQKAPETALLAAGLLGAYVVEGMASAALHYDKPNALLIVCSAWLWLQTRKQP